MPESPTSFDECITFTNFRTKPVFSSCWSTWIDSYTCSSHFPSPLLTSKADFTIPQRVAGWVGPDRCRFLAGATDDLGWLAGTEASMSDLLYAASPSVCTECCWKSCSRTWWEDRWNGRLSDPTREQASVINCSLLVNFCSYWILLSTSLSVTNHIFVPLETAAIRVHRVLEKSLKVLEFWKKIAGPWKSLKSPWIWMFQQYLNIVHTMRNKTWQKRVLNDF